MKHVLTFLILLAMGCQVLAQEAKTDMPSAETPAAQGLVPEAPAEDSHYEYLKDLEWMIGQWVDQGANAEVATNCRWTKNKNFITRSFSMKIEGFEPLIGIQIIGWDPVDKTIRSWIFDSEGGFGQATWTQKGKKWVIRASQVLKGGEKASAINVLTYVDDNTFKWQSTGRAVGGQMLPNIPEVTIVKKQPAGK